MGELVTTTMTKAQFLDAVGWILFVGGFALMMAGLVIALTAKLVVTHG